ncbi:MAG: acylphosphatase [Coriobacteriaceae bacterium]|nr:acylphosphatase [Coriobacteriaceae bacterium]
MRFFKFDDKAPEPKPLSATSRRVAVHFVGMVQGVGFRWTCREIARELGLTGWVRNEYDGSVSLEIQGEGSDISKFFTELTANFNAYRFRINFTIDEKEDIPLIPGERDFSVVF